MEETILNEEYETQFYGFSPSDVMEGIKLLIDGHFEEVISILHNQMSQFPTKVLPEAELIEGILKLRKVTNEHINKIFSKLQTHLFQCINIPSHVLLPEDNDQIKLHSKNEVEELEDEIKALRIQIKNEKYQAAILREEYKEIEVVLQFQKEFLQSSFGHKGLESINAIKEKLIFLCHNMGNNKNVSQALLATCSVQDDYFQKTFRSLVEYDSLQ